MSTVRLAHRAERDVRRIDAWWRENRLAAPDLFASDLSQAIRPLRGAPEIGPLREVLPGDGVRRILLRQTQFHAYYRFDFNDDCVVIVALWATQRGRAPSLR